MGVVRGVMGGKEDFTAGPVTADVDGWGQIDGLSAWDCSLNVFTAMVEVPEMHKEKFVLAVSIVLRRIQQAATEEELTRVMKWWLILPQALLRQAKRSGAKGQKPTSFQAVTEGD